MPWRLAACRGLKPTGSLLRACTQHSQERKCTHRKQQHIDKDVITYLHLCTGCGASWALVCRRGTVLRATECRAWHGSAVTNVCKVLQSAPESTESSCLHSRDDARHQALTAPCEQAHEEPRAEQRQHGTELAVILVRLLCMADYCVCGTDAFVVVHVIRSACSPNSSLTASIAWWPLLGTMQFRRAAA